MRATEGSVRVTIVTLIAAGRLDERLLRAALDRVAGARLDAWVEPGSAADLEMALAPARRAPPLRVGRGSTSSPIAGAREKRLLVADMDSTMIGRNASDELADYADQAADRRDHRRAMQARTHFAAALRERVALLDGLEENAITLCLAERIRPNPGAADICARCGRAGAMTLLVSGALTAFAGPVGEMIGFERIEATSSPPARAGEGT